MNAISTASYPAITTYYCTNCNYSSKPIKETVISAILPREFWDDNYDIPEACKKCKNHPSNGGNGVCCCVLGASNIWYGDW